MAERLASRRRAVSDMKRSLILEAARRVFVAEGLEGASLRAIAAEAGYTPAALYFHFDSLEAIYAALLADALAALELAVASAVARATRPAHRLEAAALAWFDHYAENPDDLELGFYLFRARLEPRGLGRERDAALNEALERTLLPIADAARDLGASRTEARQVMAQVFAHASGLLMLSRTGRTRMLGVDGRQLMKRYVETVLAAFEETTP